MFFYNKLDPLTFLQIYSAFLRHLQLLLRASILISHCRHLTSIDQDLGTRRLASDDNALINPIEAVTRVEEFLSTALSGTDYTSGVLCTCYSRPADVRRRLRRSRGDRSCLSCHSCHRSGNRCNFLLAWLAIATVRTAILAALATAGRQLSLHGRDLSSTPGPRR